MSRPCHYMLLIHYAQIVLRIALQVTLRLIIILRWFESRARHGRPSRTRQLMSCRAGVSAAPCRQASSQRMERCPAAFRRLPPATAGSSSDSSVMTSGCSAAHASSSRAGVTYNALCRGHGSIAGTDQHDATGACTSGDANVCRTHSTDEHYR